jgi:hypothetical protein
VPYEQLRKSFRYQHKYIEKELTSLHDKIERCMRDTSLSPEKASAVIDDLLKQVDKLTRKVRWPDRFGSTKPSTRIFYHASCKKQKARNWLTLHALKRESRT